MTFSLPQISKENNFNFIRLFCCFLVISMHILDISGTASVFRPFFDGHIAVCVFFILSGFWVTKSFLSSKNLKEYFVKRSLRILPLYYISVGGGLVAFAFASELPVKDFFANVETWKYLFWNCIFLNFMHPTLPGCFEEKFVPVNGALWTLKIEIAFYILLPVFIAFLRKLKSLKQINISFLVLYVFSVAYTFFFQRYAVLLHLPHQLANQFPAFVSCFIAGMFCLFNWDFINSKINILIIPSVLIFALHYVFKTEFFTHAAITFIVIFIAIKIPLFNFVKCSVDYSYPMYLVHFPLIQLMVHYNFYKANFSLAVFLTFAGTFLLSIVAKKIVNALALVGACVARCRNKVKAMSVSEPRT